MNRSELLVKFGFIKKDARDKYKQNEKKEYEAKPGHKFSGKDAEEEVREMMVGEFLPSGFPKSIKTYRLLWAYNDFSLEEPYFWVLDNLKKTMPVIEKIEDSFAAAENSAFFGVTQQRLGAQQDKVSQFLATTGKMVKELFQMVRELRILDERIDYYDGVEKELKKPLTSRRKGDSITLKGIFVDLVQGGGKSASSVYGMARELEFITLPDLFFDAPPFKNKEELERHIGGMRENFNENLLRVLHRHLHQYMHWRLRTSKEHKNRKRFMLSYLEQHYQIIQLYITWLKPYLRHVQKLTLKEGSMSSADIVSAFEGSMLDVELLSRNEDSKTGANSVVLATFNFRTRAELKVHQDYQRGPVHVGQMELFLRVYTWSREEVENYKRLKEKEGLELMGAVSKSIKKAIEGLGLELEKYLEEARSQLKGEKKDAQEKVEEKSMMERFLGDFYTPGKQQKKKPKVSKSKSKKEEVELKKVLEKKKGHAQFTAWGTFHYFKKAHRMIAW